MAYTYTKEQVLEALRETSATYYVIHALEADPGDMSHLGYELELFSQMKCLCEDVREYIDAKEKAA